MAALAASFDAALPHLLYWDASFLVHAVYPPGRYHRECYALLERLSSAQDTLSYISVLALDEAVFALLQLRVAENHPGRSFWDIYRDDPHAVQPYLGELRALVDRLSADRRIRLVSTENDSMAAALDYMNRYPLLPRDALHLTIMAHNGIDSLVTTDEDFLPVDWLHIYTCNRRILAEASSV